MAELWSRETAAGVSVRPADANTRLAQASFTAGDAGDVSGAQAFRAITPLDLAIGAYTIVAYGYGPSEQNGNNGLGAITQTLNDGGGLIAFVGTARFSPASTNGTTIGDTADGGPAARYLAGSFEFAATTTPPIPVPAALPLLLVALAGMATLRARR